MTGRITTTAWRKTKAFEVVAGDDPISRIKTYGRGRVFYCSLGVQEAAYSSPLFLQPFLAGIQFATGGLAADATPSEKWKTTHCLAMFVSSVKPQET